MKTLTFTVLDEIFTVHRLKFDSEIPNAAFSSPFFSITRTHDELSIVCDQKTLLESEKAQSDWAALKVIGPLDFSEVGILANIATSLAQSNISIFAISTFDTDYILLPTKHLSAAKQTLINAGHTFNHQGD